MRDCSQKAERMKMVDNKSTQTLDGNEILTPAEEDIQKSRLNIFTHNLLVALFSLIALMLKAIFTLSL